MGSKSAVFSPRDIDSRFVDGLLGRCTVLRSIQVLMAHLFLWEMGVAVYGSFFELITKQY